MFLLLSFISAFSICMRTYALGASATAKSSSYISFTAYDTDHATCQGSPIFVTGARTSTCEYKNTGSYSGPGDLATISTTTPAPGQIGIFFNTYTVDEVADLMCPVDKYNYGNVGIKVVTEETCLDWNTAYGSVSGLGTAVISDEEESKLPELPGVVFTFYNNDQKGLDACNDAEGSGASSTSSSAVGYQWFPTDYCNDVSYHSLDEAGGNYYKLTCGADGSATLNQYNDKTECQNGAQPINSEVLGGGNALCSNDWTNNNGISDFTLFPGFISGMYHTSIQCKKGTSPKPAPKAKQTKAPAFLKKGKKIMVAA